MTIYTYTNDKPSTDPAENKRLGYRTPRSILLPPYLAINPYFTDFADAVDEVFESTVDIPTEVLGNLRNMWVQNPTMETEYIQAEQLIPFSAWSQPEREILVKQVNALGLKLQSAGVLTDDNYQTVARFVGRYWFQKGTQSFIDFINYCLSTTLTVVKLWTQDYVNFVPEGDPSIGTPLWEGGTWYPTTHVSLVASGGLQQLDPQTLINFFYEIANYNLVLHSIELSYDLYIVDTIEEGYTDATVVAMGLWTQSNIVISNTFQIGAAAPPVYNVAPQVPVGAYVEAQPPNSNMTGVYLLSAPTAWLKDPEGRIFPVYTPQDQTVSVGSNLPCTLCGGPSTTGEVNGFMLITGPAVWTQVPGSSRSKARIPTYNTIPVAKTQQLQAIPTTIVGNQRENLLVNPAGWADLTGTGRFTPYWLD